MGLDDAALSEAAKAACEELKNDYAKQLDSHKITGPWADWKKIGACDAKALNAAWAKWIAAPMPISQEEQAIAYFALRWTLEAQRYFGKGDAKGSFDFKGTESAVLSANAKLLDYPTVRFLMRQAEKIELEAEMSATNKNYQERCLAQLSFLDSLAKRFLKNEQGFQFAVFSNIYQMDNGKLGERLSFIMGQPAKLRVRVSSYANIATKGTVTLQPPPGWKCECASVKFSLEPNSCALLDFSVTAGSAEPAPIGILTKLEGRPAVYGRADDIQVIPAVGIEPFAVRQEELGSSPLKVTLFNHEKKAVSGYLKLLPSGRAGGGVAAVRISLPPSASTPMEIKLDENAVEAIKAHDFMLDAAFSLDDGRNFSIDKLDIDFTAAKRFTAPPKIDGTLDKWKDALPLRLDKEEYSLGTFGGSWTPEDASATSYLGWDDSNIYFAALVKDQTFNQRLVDDGMWQQDSIQLVFSDGKSSKYDGFTLALSPKGPQIWSEREMKSATGGELAVVLNQGQAIYEAKLPISCFSPETQAAIKSHRFHYSLALNDDDAIVPRRVLERFPNTIVYNKDVNSTPATALLETEMRKAAGAVVPKAVFYDDFKSYPDGSIPFGYHFEHNLQPDGFISVKSGMLHVVNPMGEKPNCFSIITMPVKVVPGRRYRLSAEVKGSFKSMDAIGMASDFFGNNDYNYIAMPAGCADWKPSRPILAAP